MPAEKSSKKFLDLMVIMGIELVLMETIMVSTGNALGSISGMLSARWDII